MALSLAPSILPLALPGCMCVLRWTRITYMQMARMVCGEPVNTLMHSEEKKRLRPLYIVYVGWLVFGYSRAPRENVIERKRGRDMTVKTDENNDDAYHSL